MKIVPISAPAPVPGTIANAQLSARDRAVKQLADTMQDPAPAAPKAPVQAKIVESAPVIQAKTQETSGQMQSTEAPAEVTPAAAKPEETPLSSQYAQLARKEKALRAQAQAIKTREDALKAAEAPRASTQEAQDPSKYINIEDFKKNPWKYAQQAGVTYDQLTQEALNAPSAEATQLMSTVEALKSEIQALKADQDSSKKANADSQTAQYKQAVNQIRSEVKQLVFASDDYEACKATNSVEDVVELIEKTFAEDGVLMDVATATKQIEDYLEEEAYKLSQLKKIQARLKKGAQEETPSKEASTDPKQPQKTLTNALGASRQLTARERAMAAAQHGPSWRDKT